MKRHVAHQSLEGIEVFQNPDKEIRKEFLVKSNEASYVNECGTEHV